MFSLKIPIVYSLMSASFGFSMCQKKYPKLDRSESLSGTVTNLDGIRDDIYKIINDYPITKDQKRACIRFSKTNQLILTTDLNEDNAYELALDISRSVSCVFIQFPDEIENRKYMNSLHAINFNTESRVKKYLTYERLIGGRILPLQKCDIKF